MCQKWEGDCGLWDLTEIFLKEYAESLKKIILNLEKVFSNLEPEGQGGGIVMGVTRPLLLGPFYYIQTKFSILLCTRLYFQKLFFYESGKCGNFHVVSALLQFLLHNLNSCRRNY